MWFQLILIIIPTIQYIPPEQAPNIKIQNQLRYHGIFRFIYGVPELAAEDAEEDAELLMIISLLLEANCSTAFHT